MAKTKKEHPGAIVIREKETLPTAIIKTDTNLARLPFFALSRKGLKNKKQEKNGIQVCGRARRKKS